MKTKIIFYSLALLFIGCKQSKSLEATSEGVKLLSGLNSDTSTSDQLIGEYTYTISNGAIFKLKIDKKNGIYTVSRMGKKSTKWKVEPATEISSENIKQYTGEDASKNIEYALETNGNLIAKMSGQTVIKNPNYTEISNAKYAVITTNSVIELNKIK